MLYWLDSLKKKKNISKIALEHERNRTPPLLTPRDRAQGLKFAKFVQVVDIVGEVRESK